MIAKMPAENAPSTDETELNITETFCDFFALAQDAGQCKSRMEFVRFVKVSVGLDCDR